MTIYPNIILCSIKTYSKEGLARKEKLNPEEEVNENACKWITKVIEQLNQLVDESDVEIECLSTGKGKKSNKNVNAAIV